MHRLDDESRRRRRHLRIVCGEQCADVVADVRVPAQRNETYAERLRLLVVCQDVRGRPAVPRPPARMQIVTLRRQLLERDRLIVGGVVGHHAVRVGHAALGRPCAPAGGGGVPALVGNREVRDRVVEFRGQLGAVDAERVEQLGRSGGDGVGHFHPVESVLARREPKAAGVAEVLAVGGVQKSATDHIAGAVPSAVAHGPAIGFATAVQMSSSG